MLTDAQIRALQEQHAAAQEATSRAERLWRSFHLTVNEFYDTGQATRPRTTNPAIGAVVGVTPQQVHRWRKQAQEHG